MCGSSGKMMINHKHISGGEATMSSVQGLREFVSERLTSAAEEIFRVFEQTVVEYEKEIVRQRRLLDIVWKPEIKLHRTKLPQQHVCRKKKEVLTDQQLCDQETNSSLDQEDPQTPTAAAEEIPRVTQNIILEFNEDINYQRRLLDLVWKPEIKLHRTELPQQHICKEEEVHSDQAKNSSLDQEDPEPPQIKEEQERLCTNQEGEQLVLNQKNDVVMFTPTNEEIDHSGQEPKSDQLLSHNSPVAECQDQRGSNDVDPGSTRDEESKREKRKRTRHNNTSHSDYVDNSFPTKRHRNTHTGKKCSTCDICGKSFRFKSILVVHMRIHTGEKPYSCKTCGKGFARHYHLQNHMMSHTSEKPYPCNNCGKAFKTRFVLNVHMRIHTGEKPYTCKTCGKGFKQIGGLNSHMSVHSDERLYSCETCGKRFKYKRVLVGHMRIHTGEKPYSCKACGKCFGRHNYLKYHMMSHTREKPYPCNNCGKAFKTSYVLKVHMRNHTGEKPFSCKTCGKSFSQLSSLHRHIRIHTV
ncbi:zinc finger protein with KRAB and SCAN domains 8 isoform X1 [Hippoglossus stenolepis]|uniref:zinc finger protein with KRAB and SCAN domains 8 isoform X1 n=1 Tax=Hippoglossus stenolepis TaxID=195615 RepID=UPI001FAED28F|nr:zinc finger protein with KRAB and SCAN domains 8 isoform X1 [Hippoglossus stenolepis]